MAAVYLLDTNVISETRKVRANEAVIAFLALAPSLSLFISVLTLGELSKGVEAKRRIDPAAAQPLEGWVDEIETNFADRILPLDTAVATCWGKLSAVRSMPVVDTLIAATALGEGKDAASYRAADSEAAPCRLAADYLT